MKKRQYGTDNGRGTLPSRCVRSGRLPRAALLAGAVALLLWNGCSERKTAGGEAQLIPAANFDTTLRGSRVGLYTLQNEAGMTVQITNYGARLVALWVPDADGAMCDVIWGYESIADYLASPDRFGGPVVGRYGNRIARGQFTLDGKDYRLTVNDGENHIHGGSDGFWNRVWNARESLSPQGEPALELYYRSADGEEGYPGNLDIRVTYTLQQNNALRIDYRASTDAPTIVNPTSHAYFNLHGSTAHSTDSHLLTINADAFTPTDAGLIPTGEIRPVEGTPLDFRTPTPIGERIGADYEPMLLAKGYDHNWVLNRAAQGLTLAATVTEPGTGIEMKVWTDQPAIQFYSGNFMDGTETGKRGDSHDFRTGIALETQNYPDAPNHPSFPSAVLRPGETYTHTCVYAFGTTAKATEQ